MNKRLLPALLLISVLIFSSLSTGSPVFMFIALILLFFAVTGYVGILFAAKSMKVSIEGNEAVLKRGDNIQLHLTVRFRSFIPVAPVRFQFRSGSLTSEHILNANIGANRQEITIPFHASHIGIVTCNIDSVIVSDLLGLFEHKCIPDTVASETLVLPECFDIEPLRYAPGEPGSEIMSQATEDLSAPSDFRAYQTGDALKKIHWKLSARKGELLVRKYEEPELPDAVLIMDCSNPPSWGHTEAEADIKDALLETAASVFSSESGSNHGMRMPLYSNQIDVNKGMGMDIVLQYIAMAEFGNTDRFERVLLMEAGRLNQIGSVVVISARLNSAIVDAMIRIMRLGPVVRLYLITYAPDDANVLPLISKLKQSSIEVFYVSPAVA